MITFHTQIHPSPEIYWYHGGQAPAKSNLDHNYGYNGRVDYDPMAIFGVGNSPAFYLWEDPVEW